MTVTRATRTPGWDTHAGDASGYGTPMMLPKPRGPLGEALFERLRETADGPADRSLVVDGPLAEAWPDEVPDGTTDATDAALSLWVLHELSYRGFEDVPDRAETDPVAQALRTTLEDDLEQRLRERWVAGPGHDVEPADVPTALFDLVAADDGPSLAAHVHRRADRDQALELLQQRSIYHLKEADPSSWVIPRLPVRSKAALVELQFDEYGDGDPNRLHAHLFARGMDASGLRPDYGAYIDDALPEVLEMNNAQSTFGLRRHLRGAAMGHLAAFEMTSSLPSRKMAQGLERVGLPAEMAHYYSEHVEADAVHEHLAARDICGTLAEDEPGQAAEVMFGAFTCLDQEARFASAMFASWGEE